MLKERQLRILADLENTKTFISAKALTAKYDVSLRTIRNDIDEIAYEVERHGGTLFRVPNKGIRVECSDSVYRTLMEELASDSFSVLEKKQQLLILRSVFLVRANPVTVNFLAETFDVSASTMTSRLKDLEESLALYHITLTGVKKKGYYLGGTVEDLVSLADATAQEIRSDVFLRFFWDASGPLVEEKDLELVRQTGEFMQGELDISPLDAQRIQVLLLFVARNNTSLLLNRTGGSSVGDVRVTQLEPTFNLLLNFVNSRLSTPLSRVWEQCLRLALLNHTNAPFQIRPKEGETKPRNLDLAIHRMVEASLDYYPELSAYQEDLEQDLSTHIFAIINRLGAQLDITNPLLEEIQIRFSLLFSTVKELSKTFTMYYPLLMDDNQISYLVLYFAEYLEKATEQIPLRLLVVCNSGAGVAKLLSTRIRNHFPEVESIEHTSSYQIERGKVSLTNVDLVVSTISLRNPPNLPVIVTSPFLNSDELLKMRKLMIEITESKSHSHRVFGPEDEPQPPAQSIRTKASQPTVEFDMDRNIFLAEILTETFALLGKLFPDGVTSERYPVATGIVTHIVMSLPRWTTGEFIKAYDLDELKLNYPKEFSAILSFLDQVGARLGIFIAPVEATAILRYMINDW